MTIPPLHEAVDQLRANVIASMLQTAGVTDVPKSKDGKVALWETTLVNEARIKQAYARLTPRCRSALQVLLARGPGAELRRSRYEGLLQRAGLLAKESRQRGTGWSAPRPEEAREPVTFGEVLAALLKEGLVVSHGVAGNSNAKLGFDGGLFVYVPEAIAAYLPPVSPPSRQRAEVEQEIGSSARTGQRDLYLYWSAAREKSLETTNAGLLRSSDLKRVAAQLLVTEVVGTGVKEGDLRRLFFLRRLLSALKALQVDERGNLVGVATPLFLQLEATARVRMCYEIWRDGTWWNELWSGATPTHTGPGDNILDFAPPAVSRARRKVLDRVVELARRGDEWIEIAEIGDQLRDRDENFLIDRERSALISQAGYRYYGPSMSPYLYNELGWQWDTYANDEEGGWQGVEMVFVRAVMTEAPYWLGLLDLGYASPVQPAGGGAAPPGAVAVRLTGMGRWLLLGEATPQIPAETGRVVVQPSFHIFAFDPIADSTLAQLDGFATRLNAERAIEYELSRESVYRAQSAGTEVPAIKAWLEDVTGTALPQNVSRSLDEWQTAFERITVRPQVAWLQAATPELMDAVLADPRLSQAIVKRVNGTSALVKADMADRLEKALLQAGDLPARVNDAETERRNSLILGPSGQIRFVCAVPSLYTCALLQPLAEECGGNWCITAASVRRATRLGMDAAHILADLEQVAQGGVPPALAGQIKAWAGHYGEAKLRTVTLLQFRSHAVLEELLADPELGHYMRAFEPKAKLGLAVIAPANLEHVRQLLVERGVEVSG